jgi:hypothetical protein
MLVSTLAMGLLLTGGGLVSMSPGGAPGGQEAPQSLPQGQVVVRQETDLPHWDHPNLGPLQLEGCDRRVQPASDRSSATPLLRRSFEPETGGSAPVRLEHAFVMSVDGCPVPQIVRLVPEADAAIDSNLLRHQPRGWAAE